jgi:hypothetical protein
MWLIRTGNEYDKTDKCLKQWYQYNICNDYKILIDIYLLTPGVKWITRLIHHLKFWPEHVSGAPSHSVICVI